MAVLLTVLYVVIGISFILFLPSETTRRHDHGMTLVMSFSMAWGLGIGSVTVFWFPHFFHGVHTGMYAGALAGGLVGWREGSLQIINGMASGLMGGMMGAMLVYMTPEALQGTAVFSLAVFNAFVLSLLVFLVRRHRE